LTDEDLALEALTDFLNAVEAGIEVARQTIKAKKKLYNVNAIKWEGAEGSKGKYERSEDVDSLDFKALLKDLQQHGGKMQKDGYFMWIFQNGSTIGRKRK